MTARSTCRACFVLKVKPDLVAEFLRVHRSVWPDYMAEFERAGISNYSSFVSTDGLFVGYIEATDPAAALARLGATEVDRRWQEQMSRFWEPRPGADTEHGLTLLTEAFDLTSTLKGTS